jgi:hypothetical protein
VGPRDPDPESDGVGVAGDAERLVAAQDALLVEIDVVGVLLPAAAIILITLGFNKLRTWGCCWPGPRRRSTSPASPRRR